MRYFDIVKKYYNLGFYNEADVRKFVVTKKITEEEYEKITGVEYKN